MHKIGISLGWNCSAAIYGVKHKLRQTRAEGYKTCPFDICVTPYEGLVECLAADFEDFTNSDCLELVNCGTPEHPDMIIHHTRYNILFNHESPTHGDLYRKEKWPGGNMHFIRDDYAEFKKRYNARITHFRNYITTSEKITFLISRETNDTSKLTDTIDEHFPHLLYDIVMVPLDSRGKIAKTRCSLHTCWMFLKRLFATHAK